MQVELLDRYDLSENLHCFSVGEHCGPDYRENVLAPFVEDLPRECLVLDLACGKGEAADFLETQGLKTVRLDLSLMVLGQNRGNRVRALATELPFADNSFDAIHFKDALVHVKNKRKLFREMGRILKPCGLLLVASAPNFISYFLHQEVKNQETKCKKVAIISEKNYLRKVDRLLPSHPHPETITPPYYCWFPGEIVSAAKNSHLTWIKDNKWKPQGNKDWYGATRNVYVFQKN